MTRTTPEQTIKVDEVSKGNRLPPTETHETVPTQFIQAGDVRFACRCLGPRGATPLLLCNYFAANMDDWCHAALKVALIHFRCRI